MVGDLGRPLGEKRMPGGVCNSDDSNSPSSVVETSCEVMAAGGPVENGLFLTESNLRRSRDLFRESLFSPLDTMEVRSPSNTARFFLWGNPCSALFNTSVSSYICCYFIESFHLLKDIEV